MFLSCPVQAQNGTTKTKNENKTKKPTRVTMATTWLEIATDYGVATLIGVAMNTIAKRIFPSKTIKGDPLWVYFLSIFTQMFIFPPLWLLSWREQEYKMDRWFSEPWEILGSVTWSRMHMAALWGYWVCTGENLDIKKWSKFLGRE
jgi:hypothetical protein